jgi:thiamine biosynthesis protein ThiI
VTPQSFVVHYQEIALKGKNRPWFLAQLVRSLRRAVADLPKTRVNALMGRIEVVPGPSVPPAEVADRIRHTFGIANFSLARRVPIDLDGIAAAVLQDLGDRTCRSFRVSARRADKRYPALVAADRARGGRADQGRDGVARGSRAARDRHPPRAAHQRGVLLLRQTRWSGGAAGRHCGARGLSALGRIDSPVAAYRMMKRGCTVTFVHFHSYPILSRASIEKARSLVTLLTRRQHRSRLYLVPFGEIQQQVLLSVPAPLRVVVYRRLMLRIAERIARQRRAQALVTGDVVGQVASQTLENLAVVGQVATMPLFRPLIGMDKDEIMAQAQTLGSYAISIIPDQDCCTLFTPRNPATRARFDDADAAEGQLAIEELVDIAVRTAEIEDFAFPTVAQVVGSPEGS